MQVFINAVNPKSFVALTSMFLLLSPRVVWQLCFFIGLIKRPGEKGEKDSTFSIDNQIPCVPNWDSSAGRKDRATREGSLKLPDI